MGFNFPHYTNFNDGLDVEPWIISCLATFYLVVFYHRMSKYIHIEVWCNFWQTYPRHQHWFSLFVLVKYI